MLCEAEIFTLFVFMCTAQVDFTESSLYAFKRKDLKG